MTEKELFFKYNYYPRRKIANFPFKNQEDRFLYLKNNEVLFDEIKEENFKINKFVLYIHGSYNCNSNCVYCINQKLRKDYQGKIIDDKTIKNIVLKLGPFISKAIWHGGEPLLIPESKIELLEEIKIKNNLTFATSLQTNLINMSDEKKAFLNKYKIGWGTSFDGLSNTCNRGIDSTNAFLNQLNLNPNQSCLSVITNKEIDNLIDNYEYMKKIGVKRFTTSLVRENINDFNNFLLNNPKENAYQVSKYIKYWIYDKNYIIDNFIINEINSFFGNSNHCQNSFSIGKHFIIDPFGNINLCAHDGLEDSLINVNDINDIKKDFFYNEKLLNELKAQFNFLNMCKDKECPVYNNCYGGCLGDKYSKTKYQKLDENFCDFQIFLHNYLYELFKEIDLENKNLYNDYFISLLYKNNFFSLKYIKEKGG